MSVDDLESLPAEAALEEGCTIAICTYRRARSLNLFLDSLVAHDYKPSHLIIVDASPDEETEQLVQHHPIIDYLANQLLYFRVSGPLRGLPQQRNFALRWVTTDLVAFFDDDIILLPNCLQRMQKAHRLLGDKVVGVGALIQNRLKAPSLIWRQRLLFHAVPDIQPGRYHRSGMAVPWAFLNSTEELVEGDWLPGCAMMWKTKAARQTGFNEGFSGYALGEDIDFSLRCRAHGKLVLANTAHVVHLEDPTGRPGHRRLGYMTIYNRHQIHQYLPNRSRRDIAWFSYAWTVDTLCQTRYLFVRDRLISTLQNLVGRAEAVGHIIWRTVPNSKNAPGHARQKYECKAGFVIQDAR
jgi:GT2 family glycosyltransferase